MSLLLALPRPDPAQVLPLCAVVLPEFTPKRRTHRAHSNPMANGTPYNQPDKSLEISLQDSLDGLEDFTLQMAWSTTGAQFEILSIGSATDSKNDLSAKPAPLTLVTTSNHNVQPILRRHRRI